MTAGWVIPGVRCLTPGLGLGSSDGAGLELALLILKSL